MGRRRERRQQAGGGSRRVKLDLALAQAEAGEASAAPGVAPERFEAQKENPLSLLEQYSDEEEEEEEEEDVDAIPVNSSAIKRNSERGPQKKVDEEVQSFLAELQDSGLLEDGQSPDQSFKESDRKPTVGIANPNGKSGPEAREDADSKDGGKEEKQKGSFEGNSEDFLGSVEPITAEGLRVVGEGEKWEAVVDESSGSIYYWNVATGETSWDVPVGYVASKGGEGEGKGEEEGEGKEATLVQTAVGVREEEKEEEGGLFEGDHRLTSAKDFKDSTVGGKQDESKGAKTEEKSHSFHAALSADGELRNSREGQAERSEEDGERGRELEEVGEAGEEGGGSGDPREGEREGETKVCDRDSNGEWSDFPGSIKQGEGAEEGEATHTLPERWAAVGERLRQAAGEALQNVAPCVRAAIEAELRTADLRAAMATSAPQEALWERSMARLQEWEREGEERREEGEGGERRDIENELQNNGGKENPRAIPEVTHHSSPRSPPSPKEGVGVAAVAALHEQPLGLGMLSMYSDSSAEDGEIRLSKMTQMGHTEEGNEEGEAESRRGGEIGNREEVQHEIGENFPKMPENEGSNLEEDMDVEMEVDSEVAPIPYGYSAPPFGGSQPFTSAAFPSLQSSASYPPLPDEMPPPPPPEYEDFHQMRQVEAAVPFPPTETAFPYAPMDDPHAILANIEASLFAEKSAYGSKPLVYSAPPSGPTSRTATNAVPSAATATAAAVKRTDPGRKRKVATAVGGGLKSSKRVSSMLHKWKAAKEELQEAAAEPDEFDLAAREKKKLREIEEWKAQQLAAGSVRENANFQPLGGTHWRDRVKRARQASATALATPVPAPADVAADMAADEAAPAEEGGRGRPDLAAMSVGLPPGWRAFWDASSASVYFGNLATRETAWDRPSA